jgi:integrase
MQRQHVAYLLERLPPTLPIAELDEAMIEQLVAGEGAGRRKRADGSIRPLAATTVLKRLSTLRRALKLQKRRRAIDRVPEFPEILSEYQPDVKFIPSFHEAERIAGALPAHRADWFWLALWTGQHPSDVERMTREDIDPIGADAWVRVRNTKNRRFAGVRIGCPAELARVLVDRWRELAPRARLVVPWRHVSSQLPAVCERLGLPRYTAKSLRHTFFTWMIAGTGITKAVMEIGGWSNFDMVCRVYGHALPPQFRDAVRALDRVVIDGARRPPQKKAGGVTSSVGAAEELPGTGVTSTGPGRHTKSADRAPIRIERLAGKGQSVGAERIELSTNGLRVCAPTPDRPQSAVRSSPAGTGCSFTE